LSALSGQGIDRVEFAITASRHHPGDQNVTKHDRTRPPDLTPEQSAAVPLVAAGKTDAETAAAVGVARQTVWAWRNHHPTFRAAVNREVAELRTAASAKLRGLREKALGDLEAALDGEHAVKVALRLVELLPAAAEPGPEDPAEIIDAEATRRRPAADGGFDEILGCGPVTDHERAAALSAMLSKVADAGRN
jgi:hypothetical protein